MFGKNPIRPPEKGDGQTLKVQEIFSTFQGEGPHTGTPAVFIRLGGCNLACGFCDTEFEDFSEKTRDVILSEVQDFATDETGKRIRHLIVLTGGEPLRQPIIPLCEDLQAEGFAVQLETNGTLFQPLPEGVEIVCSPKNTGSGYLPVRPDLMGRVTALKFLISADDPHYQDVAEVGQTVHQTPVYVQPMDEYDAVKNAANLARVHRLVTERGYRLSLQTHKIVGAP